MNIPRIMRGAFHDSGNLQGGAAMSNQAEYPYVTRLNVFYKPLEVIEEKALADACPHKWYNQTLCEVNNSVVRLGVVEGEYHWHKHDADDEFFYVVEGKFLIDLEDRTVELGPRQGFVVPKGVLHRPRAPQRTVILMVETAGIIPTGN
jgi:mannose-6-phosphate isomerase-like protein (cupin superfamily)